MVRVEGRAPDVAGVGTALFRPAVRSALPELVDAGAVPLDTGALAWLGELGWSPIGRPTFEVVSATLLPSGICFFQTCKVPPVTWVGMRPAWSTPMTSGLLRMETALLSMK